MGGSTKHQIYRLMRPIVYNILNFSWDAKRRTFYGYGYSLDPTNNIYDESFPSGKEPFWIKNFKTGNTRLFSYIGSDKYHWIFASDCGILCKIVVDPNIPFNYLFEDEKKETLEAVC